jgi:hypothetical protein
MHPYTTPAIRINSPYASLQQVIWPSMSVPGEGGNISDVLFDGATFRNTNQAVREVMRIN